MLMQRLGVLVVSIIPNFEDALACETVGAVQLVFLVGKLRCNALFNDWKHHFNKP